MKYKFNKKFLDYIELDNRNEYTISNVILKLKSKLNIVNEKFIIDNKFKNIIDNIIINDCLTIGDLKLKHQYWQCVFNNGVTLSWINNFVLNYFVESKYEYLNNFNLGQKVNIITI